MKKAFAITVAALGMLALPAIAAAQTAQTNARVNLRTGPDAGYPNIVTLAPRTRLQVYGCVNDWSWCDVSTGRERGWVSAAYLDYPHNGHNVTISHYGGQIGLPVLSFVLGAYWDSHYRDKSWYPQRSRWENHAPARQAAPARARAQEPNQRANRQEQPSRPAANNQPTQRRDDAQQRNQQGERGRAQQQQRTEPNSKDQGRRPDDARRTTKEPDHP